MIVTELERSDFLLFLLNWLGLEKQNFSKYSKKLPTELYFEATVF